MNLAALQHLVRSVRTLAQDHEMIVLGSASLLASFHSLEKAMARCLISFQESGMGEF